MDYDIAITGDFGEALGNIVLGNQLSADLGDLVLVRLADVEKEHVLAGVDALLEFLHGDLGNFILKHVVYLTGEKPAKRNGSGDVQSWQLDKQRRTLRPGFLFFRGGRCSVRRLIELQPALRVCEIEDARLELARIPPICILITS